MLTAHEPGSTVRLDEKGRLKSLFPMLTPTVEAIAEQYSASAAVVELNVDDNPSTAEAYGIRGIPTLILFSDGKEVERVIGAASKETISRMIEKYSCLPRRQSQFA